MNNMGLIESFTDFKKYNHIDSVTLMTILEYSILNTVIKKYRHVENLDLFIDYENGSIDIWRNRIIVDEIQESNKEIDISSAKQIEYDFEVGEEITEQFALKLMDRRYILTFKYNFYLKSKEYCTIQRYNNFRTRIGDIVVGKVFHARKDLIIRDDDHNDLFMPKNEQMFNDFMRKRESIRAIIKNVYWEDSQPIIILSRTGPNFIQKLFEQEIPEILDGFIIVKQVVRIPGEKSKVSVESSDSHIDPVGTCLGVKGIRLHAIVKELKTENLDVIKYSKNIKLYILRALSTTKISMIEIDEQNKKAMISLKYEQVSKARGRKGKNIRLAGKITGYKINILRNYYSSYNKYEEEISKFVS
ncbi:transcription elongation factor NusA [Candidatus Uzinura diaspidicola str. ASNER]|uniref:Transcription termination/antitermination protein NusA n=1 Tax=Candidatus Uzinura diaspidicola str. ASNER TaxID=1133592 RepID=L7VMK3_9FLAO|nr:transcription elongation factor NusA [Candidatus Uzinura diaspidicola str. ASNER]